jgi:hypothetical protein
MASGRVEGRSDGDLRGQWRERLGRFEQRQGTVAAFCAQESISVWSLYDWRRKLMSAKVRADEGAGKEADRFVDVGTMRLTDADRDGAPARAPADIEVRIDLGGGRVLQILRR